MIKKIEIMLVLRGAQRPSIGLATCSNWSKASDWRLPLRTLGAAHTFAIQ
ncbi:hypothetical protein Scep_004437 [Stephania cephalantha]|uniref:Uncharacterized protein n=1 Tax=Stephania cephalantha TaxID=152367 RepID=A0AAP0KTW7_9MAGN